MVYSCPIDFCPNSQTSKSVQPIAYAQSVHHYTSQWNSSRRDNTVPKSEKAGWEKNTKWARTAQRQTLKKLEFYGLRKSTSAIGRTGSTEGWIALGYYRKACVHQRQKLTSSSARRRLCSRSEWDWLRAACSCLIVSLWRWTCAQSLNSVSPMHDTWLCVPQQDIHQEKRVTVLEREELIRESMDRILYDTVEPHGTANHFCWYFGEAVTKWLWIELFQHWIFWILAQSSHVNTKSIISTQMVSSSLNL